MVSLCCFFLRFSLSLQLLHGLLMLRHGFPVPGVALNRGPAHDVEAVPDEAALRGPDEGGDPYGGSLDCKRGLLKGEGGLLQREHVLLHGEACGFVFRHSLFSPEASWGSQFGQFRP